VTQRAPPTTARGPDAEGARHDALEGAGGEQHPFARAPADPQALDEHEPRALDVLGRVFDERLARAVQAVGPAAVGHPGVDHALLGARHGDVVGRQEALFLVGELFVEGAARDAGERDHVCDGGGRVSPLVHRLDHRAVQTRALVARHRLAAHSVRPVRQSSVQRLQLTPCSTHPHDSNIQSETLSNSKSNL
jgi:hypothetical protein